MDISEAIDRFRGPLIGLIASWGAPLADACELAQDSLADAYLNRHNCTGDFHTPEVFGRWLRGVAKNKFRTWLRSRRRRTKHVVTMAADALEQSACDNSKTNAAEEDPRIHRLRHEIDRLPSKLRQVILMHYLEETTVKDVAALLGVTPKAVEGRLYQGRRRLKQRIEESSEPIMVLRALML